MLFLLLTVYCVPVYLVFFKFKWLPMNRTWKIILPVPPVVFLLFLWITLGMYTPTTQDAYAQAAVVQIAPQVNGVVTRVLVAENAAVKAGTPLFEIDPRPFRFAVDQAEARLIEARQGTAGSVAGVVSGEDSIHRAEASAEAADRAAKAAELEYNAAQEAVSAGRAQEELARKDLDRKAELVKSGAVSQQDYDGAVRDAAVRKADLAGAESRAAKAYASLEQARAQAAAANLAIGEAFSARSRAMVQLDPVLAVNEALAFRTAYDPKLAAASLVKPYVEANPGLVPDMLGKAAAAARFLGTASAAARQAEEGLNKARFDLECATVVAPSDGIVANLQVSPGTSVRAGNPAVALIATDKWQLVANFPENWLRKIRPGDRAIYSLRNYPMAVRETTVREVGRGVISGQGIPNGILSDPAPRVTRQTATPATEARFPVHLALEDDRPDEPLRVGATGRVTIYASGGFPVTSTLATVLHWIMSFLDILFPKPPMLLLVVVIAVVGIMYWRKRSGPAVHPAG